MNKCVQFFGSYCICISKCTVRKTVKYTSTLSLTSSIDRLCCQRHAPAAFPWERLDTHCIGGWVGPRFGPGQVRKISPPPVFDPRTVQPVASHYTDSRRKGIWLLYHVLRQVESSTERLELSYVLWFCVSFVSYDKPTWSCSVSGPVVSSWALSAVI